MFEFPDLVDERAARVAAGVVASVSAAAVGFGLGWLAMLLVVDFGAKVAFGPRWSVTGRLGHLSVRGLGAPRLVSGESKRFAAFIGLLLSLGAAATWVSGSGVWPFLLVALAAAASLESLVGLCLGCVAYRSMARRGWLGAARCVDCAPSAG